MLNITLIVHLTELFLDDNFNRQYEAENQLSDISKIFSILAIFIACIGLLGLVSFTLEQKAKEISIRKVLGASIASILLMINKSYALLILIAFLVAIPLSIYALDSWLGSFAYHINIGIGIISVAGILTGALAVITICSQAMRFATANPIKMASERLTQYFQKCTFCI
ncbi:ABC transporter permease [Roseivirga sp.]|uniref:ABC transporter permease n=1 Tax=Roseivirga sp. TaxID=1964215 RepID=UPI003BAB9BAD